MVIKALALVAATYVAQAVEPHPAVYKVLLSCPAGGFVQINSEDPDLIISYILAVKGDIGPKQLTEFILSKHPDQEDDLKQFVKQCLGSGQGRS